MSSKRHSLNQHIKGKGKGLVLCPVVCVAKVSIAANSLTSITRFARAILITYCLQLDWTPARKLSSIKDDFTTEILAKFHNEDIGKLCRSEPTIVLIGRKRFQRNRGKVDKLIKIKKSVMTEMRLLSKLCIAFSEAATGSNISAKDMFVRTNFNVLAVAIEQVTTAESSVLKHGVKNGLYYLLKNSAIIVMSSYLGEGDDNNAAEVEKFIHYLELNRDTVFADAVYAINKSRQEQLRMSEQRADEKQVIVLKMHTERRVKPLSNAYEIVTRKTYIKF